MTISFMDTKYVMNEQIKTQINLFVKTNEII